MSHPWWQLCLRCGLRYDRAKVRACPCGDHTELLALARAVVDAEDVYMNAQSPEDIGAGAARSEQAIDALRIYLAGQVALQGGGR